MLLNKGSVWLLSSVFTSIDWQLNEGECPSNFIHSQSLLGIPFFVYIPH